MDWPSPPPAPPPPSGSREETSSLIGPWCVCARAPDPRPQSDHKMLRRLAKTLKQSRFWSLNFCTTLHGARDDFRLELRADIGGTAAAQRH